MFAVVLSACMTPMAQSGATTPQMGQANPGASYEQSAQTTYRQPSTPPAPLQGGKVDPTQSKALTDYLKSHHLPLVGAQVLKAPDGQRQVILFGYVATEYGRGDADSRVHRYINDPSVTIDNRIKVEPTLVKSAPTTTGPQAENANNLSGVQDYENQRYQDQVQQQQAYQYQNQGPSPMSTIVPMLGMFGGSFGGAGMGIGGGGFRSGFGGGSYGGAYPMSPPPSYPSYPSYP
ncbi:MAG TPA: hypothetical protein VJX23_07705 [Candidatus Binataceae bacterium]|nr:hypothetical protein [Candidatus Binataceae bacterium]